MLNGNEPYDNMTMGGMMPMGGMMSPMADMTMCGQMPGMMPMGGMMQPMADMTMGGQMPGMMPMGGMMQPMADMTMGGQMPGMMPMGGMMQPMADMTMGAMMPGADMTMSAMMPGMMPAMPMHCMPMNCMPMQCMPMHCMPQHPHQQPCPCGMNEPDYVDFNPPHSHHHENYENFVDALNRTYPNLSNAGKELLKRLMAIDFAIIDLNLYLDTHPTDARALAQHNRYVAMREPLARRFEEIYGPLTPNQRIEYPWAWLNQPWPWRIQF